MTTDGQGKSLHTAVQTSDANSRPCSTYAEVALQPWQYSCWNADYRYRIENLGPGDSQYDACLPVVRDMCSNYQDITHGANHYYANYIAEPSCVDWDKFTVQVGLHYFFKL